MQLPWTLMTFDEALVNAAHLVLRADPEETRFPKILARVKEAQR